MQPDEPPQPSAEAPQQPPYLKYGMKPWGAVHACREARAALEEAFIPPTPLQRPPLAWIDWSTIQVNISQLYARALLTVDWSRKIVTFHLQEYRCFYDFFPHEHLAAVQENELITHLEGVERLFLTPLARPYARFGEDVFFYGTWCQVLALYVGDQWSDGKVVYVRHDDVDEEDWLSTENYRARRYFRSEPRRTIAEVGLEEYLGLNVLVWTDGVLGPGLRNERQFLLAQAANVTML